MAQPRRPTGDNMNGSGKNNMSSQRKDNSDGRFGGGSGRAQNGSRSAFRTDTAISNNRPGAERTLKRWVPDSTGDLDGALENTPSTGKWDQFAENERLFGLKTDYNENYYTTAIDRSHPKYSERLAAADRAAREIERSAPVTAHVAEERVMDFQGGDEQGGDEEDKYSGVRRQVDFPPLSSNRDNKYTPPARRAPTAHSTVKGAPVDPAIISAQVKGGPGQGSRKQQTPTPQSTPQSDESKTPAANASHPSSIAATPKSKTPEPAAEAKPAAKPPAAKDTTEPTKLASVEKSTSKPTTPAASASSLRASTASGRASMSPSAKAPVPLSSSSAANSPAPPSVTENVENALLKDFKDFATQQRQHAEKARHSKMKADAQVKLQELKKFAEGFKLSTPVPNDLISIIAKDPVKQKKIQEKALQNAEELAKTKAEPAKPKAIAPGAPAAAKVAVPKVAPLKAVATAAAASSNTTSHTSASTPASAVANASNDDNKPTLSNARSQGQAHNSHGTLPMGMSNRHPNARGSYIPQGFRPSSQAYRGDRSGPQHVPSGHNTGNLAERIRSSDQSRYNKPGPPHGPSHFNPQSDMRPPPTGPSNLVDPNFSRRLSGIPPGPHMGQKLNPATHEFRPSPFAPSFNPTGPSAGSSPRSAINNMSSELTGTVPSSGVTAATAPSPRAVGFMPIRRKTAAVNLGKFQIFAHIKTIKPPEARNWNDNDGLRPSFDTPLLWRQVQDDEKPESTMHLTFKQFFERHAFAASAVATPLQGHVVPHGMPQMQHQPMHLQPHMGHVGARPSPHMQHIPMHAGASGPHGHLPHMSFNGNDDHRMIHSNSAQSYASPRLVPVPMYSHLPGPAPPVAFNPPAMQPFMPNAPQVNQFRSFSNTPQSYMTPQSGPMMPLVPPQHFVAVPGGIQQMPMYPGGPQFMAPPGSAGPGSGGVPQQMGGSNGYPSPGRPVAAPVMVQQGSQQGQSVYGMSPNMQYQQPAFGPQHPGQGGPMRGGYNSHGPQQFGTSPQSMQYGPSHRNGSGHYGKHYQNHGYNSHQGPPPHQNHSAPTSAAHQGRPVGGDGGSEEAK